MTLLHFIIETLITVLGIVVFVIVTLFVGGTFQNLNIVFSVLTGAAAAFIFYLIAVKLFVKWDV